ncbi:MAG: TetR/AcrR family transcriptional regulator [Firmicutes bacterium HGW-Firmicutes-5]|nr:MAG: TetR/AcrR family transcriptional regulator [Firmicutes bacterium HGW-Firmicutes-5]
MGDKGQKTKEMICQKSYELFAAKGFKEVTMTDICESTGLSRGGLYRHYSSTAEIFDEILSAEYVFVDRINNGESAESILNNMLLLIEEEIMEKELSLSLAIYEYANLGKADFFVRINNRAKERWGTLIEYGIKTGEFNEVNIDQVVELILYYYQGLRMWSRVVQFSEFTAANYSSTIKKILMKN